MSTIEVRVQTNNTWRLLLVAPVGMALFYYLFGYMPVSFWILGGTVILVLPFSLLRRSGGPCIVLSDEGILDKRLKVGVIHWRDVKRAYRYSLHGVPYVCLDLHNLKEYEARRPILLRFLSSFQRLFGMSPIAISASGLDLDSEALLSKIHAGCQAAYQK